MRCGARVVEPLVLSAKEPLSVIVEATQGERLAVRLRHHKRVVALTCGRGGLARKDPQKIVVGGEPFSRCLERHEEVDHGDQQSRRGFSGGKPLNELGVKVVGGHALRSAKAWNALRASLSSFLA